MLVTASTATASRRKDCVRACAGTIAECARACTAFGDLDAACKRAVLARCKHTGVQACLASTTTTSTTSIAQSSTTTVAQTTTTSSTSTTIPCPYKTCPTNPSGGPSELDFDVADSGTDLDNGWTGIMHNYPVPSASRLGLCLSGCDANTNPVCAACGPVGLGSVNGDIFGPPLPIIAQGVPVCVLNRYQRPPSGKVNVQTGEVTADDPIAVDLFSDAYLTLNSQVCPRCNTAAPPTIGATGTCDSGQQLGAQCKVDSVLNVTPAFGSPVYALSRDCLPDPAQFVGTLAVRLRLTTATSTLAGPTPCTQGEDDPVAPPIMDDNCGGGLCTPDSCTGYACMTTTADGKCIDNKGGLSQACCSIQTNLPCFTTRNGESIVRTGKADPPAPVWPDPTYPKTSSGGVLVSTFCEAPTRKAVINNTAGLPGPGALILPGTQTLLQ